MRDEINKNLILIEKWKISFYKFLQCAIINLMYKKKLIVCFKKGEGI